jgi:hypothetical protein
MTRAQQLIAMYEKKVAPKMTDLGNEVVKQVDTLLKAQLKELNPVLKWEWAGKIPSEAQRISDNLEWEVTVNSHSHGDELTASAKKWVASTLTPAIEKAYGSSEYTVTVSHGDDTFPKEDDDKGDMRLVSVMVRLDKLKASGLAA